MTTTPAPGETPTALEHALRAAGRGWAVIPLRPGDKRPAAPDHPSGRCTGADARCARAGAHVTWQDRATTDTDRITRAWTAHPGWGVGIACGPSGLVVIDLDRPKPGHPLPPEWAAVPGVHDGADVLAHLAHTTGHPLPVDTYTVTTPSGGTHLYYTVSAPGPDTVPLRCTTGGTPGALGPLIDTRAVGGYVAAPGTTTPGGTYTVAHDTPPAPLPHWLATALTPRPLPPQHPTLIPLTPAGDTGARTRAYLTAALAGAARTVTDARAGTRNRALYTAAVGLGQLLAGAALTPTDARDALTHAAHTAGLTPTETTRTITSGLTAGANRPRHLPPSTSQMGTP